MAIAPAPIAHPHRASPIAQMETNAQGHHDHNRRRARVQNVRTPFGSRLRVSACGRRYPGRCFGRRHTGGWLVGRGPTAGLAVWVVVMVTYGKRAAPAPAGAGNAQLLARMAPMNPVEICECWRGWAAPREFERQTSSCYRHLVPCLLYEWQLRLSGGLLGNKCPITRREASGLPIVTRKAGESSVKWSICTETSAGL